MARYLSRFLILALLIAAPAAAEPAVASEAFPFPPGLRPAVDFWKDVFTRLDYDQVVYFDAYDVSRVYEIRRLPGLDGSRAGERRREAAREAHRDRLRDDLLTLAADGVDYDALSGRLRRLYLTWDRSRDPAVYRDAAENIRTQRGARDSFLSGVSRSARYMEAFRAIFREEGVPEDLAYLPHVESAFLWNARSGVGAVGMWQFMAGTAKRYLRIHPAVDERLDPYAAARAAARYLTEAHAELGSWPLTITAYNQGTASMQNAQITLGTSDIERVIAEYRGPRYGFAGRNFYPEFLAAREAASALLAEPGDLPLDPPQEFTTWELPAWVQVSKLRGALGVSRSDLEALNPALTTAALGDREYVPRGTTLKLPPELGPDADRLFAALPASDRPHDEPIRTYRVRSGDSLGGIAARFGTSVRAIQKLNGIQNPNRLRAGQTLRIPH